MNKQIAQHLLEIGAVAVQPNEPFTLSSGLKSPIYCDNRLTISYPEVRRAIAEAFEKIIRDKFPEAEVIAGAATGGIPHAAWVSENMDLPMVYVRGSAKGHGKQKQTEGVLREGQKVVVVEDLFSTGGSALKAVNGLRNEGAEVLGIVGIFTYELKKADEAFQEANVNWEAITNLTALLEIAELTDEERNKIKKWASDPGSEVWLDS